MSFARRQTIERACNLLLREPQRIGNRHPFDHLRQCRAASNRRRATVSEKARGFNPIIIHAQTQTQAITADRVRLFCDGVGVCKLADVAWIG